MLSSNRTTSSFALPAAWPAAHQLRHLHVPHRRFIKVELVDLAIHFAVQSVTPPALINEQDDQLNVG
jgi:hypothetical protein